MMTEVTAQEAKAHGLAPVHVRVDTTGTALSVTALPEPDKYMIASGPPGGPLLAIVWPSEERADDAAAIERVVRKHFAQAWQQPLVIGAPGTIAIGGRERAALAFVTGEGMRRTAWCGAIVVGHDAAVLVTLGRGAPAGTTPSCAEIASEPNLAGFARTFELRERRMPMPSGVTIRGWSTTLQKASLPHALGSLLGVAVGDALGTTHEFKTLEAPPFPAFATGPLVDVVGGGPFKLAAGQVTDDTQMAATLADLFVASDIMTAAALAQRYLAWRGVAFDVGAQINQVLDLIANGTAADKAAREVWESRNRFPAGNGSLMRTAVIGVLLAGADAETRRRATFIDSSVTHYDPRCQLACAAYNAAIAHALTDQRDPASMLHAATVELDAAATTLRLHHGDIAAEIDAAKAALASDLAAARVDDPQLDGDDVNVHKGAGFVRVAFRLAFWHLLHAPDFRTAVVDAANRGGDADTNAAIVGGLLGACHGIDGIPREWRDKVLAAEALRVGKLELGPSAFVRALSHAFGSEVEVRLGAPA